MPNFLIFLYLGAFKISYEKSFITSGPGYDNGTIISRVYSLVCFSIQSIVMQLFSWSCSYLEPCMLYCVQITNSSLIKIMTYRAQK